MIAVKFAYVLLYIIIYQVPGTRSKTIYKNCLPICHAHTFRLTENVWIYLYLCFRRKLKFKSHVTSWLIFKQFKNKQCLFDVSNPTKLTTWPKTNTQMPELNTNSQIPLHRYDFPLAPQAFPPFLSMLSRGVYALCVSSQWIILKLALH